MMIFLVVLLARANADDSFKAFTVKDGRAIEARIAKFDPRTKKVTFELRNGAKRTVAANMFTDEDQVRINDWYLASQIFSPSKLVVEVKKERGESGLYQYERNAEWAAAGPRMKFEEIAYEISLNNRSAIELKGVVVEYGILTVSERRELEGVERSKVSMNMDPNNSDSYLRNSTAWLTLEEADTWDDIEERYDTRGQWTIDILAPKIKEEQRTMSVRLHEGTLIWKGTPYRSQRAVVTRENEDKLLGIIVRVSIPLESGEYARKEFRSSSRALSSATVEWEKDGRPHPNEFESLGQRGSLWLHGGFKNRKHIAAKYTDACVQAKLYQSGDGVKKDLNKALEYYLKAYEMDPARSGPATEMGEIYLQSTPLRNAQKSIYWYEIAVKLGNRNAEWCLANLYATDKDPSVRDGEKSVKYAVAYVGYSVEKCKKDNQKLSGIFGSYQTLAQAYARDGQFKKAVETMQKANEMMAETTFYDRYIKSYNQQLERFQNGKAWPEN